MRMLLDTHTLLCALVQPSRLSKRCSSLIRDPANAVLVSSASAWEIATKFRLGKMPNAGPIFTQYAAHLAVLRAEELPIRSIHALRAGSFQVDHRDPFDRMFAAQAIVEGVPLLTADAAFSSFPELETIW